MLLQTALNGPHTRADHPAIPLTQEELARDAKACVDRGAGAVHLHPRNREGEEDLRPEVVDAVVSAVRAACGVPVGVSTGAWIEPDADRRAALIRSWRSPDYASVNLSEAGWSEAMEACSAAGVGIEAGVWTAEDAERLGLSPLAGRVLRVLVEPVDVSASEAVGVVASIHAILDGHGVNAPRLQHGDGEATWVLLEDAVRRGLDTRIGLEDTFREPGNGLTSGNAALVAAAVRLGAGRRTSPGQER